MARLLIQRLCLGALTLLAVSVLIFGGTEILPGDVATAVLGPDATPDTVAAMRHALGLDQPIALRYGLWLWSFVHGELGHSLASGRPIAAELGFRLENTLFLAASAACIAIPLAVGLGILAAIRQGSMFDRVVNLAALSMISLPEFFIGYLLILCFAVNLGWLPSLSAVSPGTPLGEKLREIALPTATLVMTVLAHMLRMTRAAIIGVMSHPYIEMARLKGLPRWRVVVAHALPNALAPIINVVAINVAYLIVGVVVVEVVFVYPGVGQLMVDAVSTRDVPVVQACGLIFGGAYVGLNIIADLLAIIANPRLRTPR